MLSKFQKYEWNPNLVIVIMAVSLGLLGGSFLVYALYTPENVGITVAFDRLNEMYVFIALVLLIVSVASMYLLLTYLRRDQKKNI